MARWKSNLQNLIRQKSERENRTISISEIMRKSDLARGTVELYWKGSLKTVNAEAVRKLCVYLDCGYADLVELDASILDELDPEYAAPAA